MNGIVLFTFILGSPYKKFFFPETDDNDGYDSDFDRPLSQVSSPQSEPIAFISPVSPTVVNIRASAPMLNDSMDVVDGGQPDAFDFDFDEAINSYAMNGASFDL